MSQLALTSPANVCDNAGTLEQQDAARTFIIGPNIALPDGFSEIQPVWGITAKELLKLGRNVLLQPEDGSIPAPPNRPTALLTKSISHYYTKFNISLQMQEQRTKAENERRDLS